MVTIAGTTQADCLGNPHREGPRARRSSSSSRGALDQDVEQSSQCSGNDGNVRDSCQNEAGNSALFGTVGGDASQDID